MNRGELREHLVRTRVAGDIVTSRENNLDNYRSLALGDSHYTFGLKFHDKWAYADILEVMAKKAGVSADNTHREGPDTIDPELTIDGLDAMADLIADAVRQRKRIIIATGHPTGLLTIHLALAQTAREHGATLLTPAEGWAHYGHGFGRRRHIRYLDEVAMLSDGGAFVHTHDPEPMEAMLAALDEPPDLVIGDHGWAGAAGQAGIETVGFADSNDPALFVGEAEGKIAVAVPLDDNVYPRHYRPVSDYLLARMGLAR